MYQNIQEYFIIVNTLVQDELKQMAEQIVTMMSQSTTADSGQWHVSHLSMWNVSRVTTVHNEIIV